MLPDIRDQGNSPEGSETYIHDYNGAITKKWMTARTAAREAAFFLPYLQSGMALLDCGCGPGTVTIGLAKAVAPGEVVAFDIEASQINIARSKAAELGLTNLRFEIEDAYELAFAGSTFDAVFAHALLEHLRHPVKALKEMHRVLKTGGIVGVRSPDFTGELIAPSNPVLDAAIELYYKFRQYNGGDPYIGRHLRALLRKAGFGDTKGSASYEYWGTTKGTRSIVDAFSSELAGPKIVEQATQLGWADKSQFEKTVKAVKEWSEHPDSFYAHAMCEAVGWKK